MNKLFAAVAAFAVGLASPAVAQQIALAPTNVVNSSGFYTAGFPANTFAPGNIFDNQTGVVSEPTQSGYWINPDDGPPAAFITIDLGAAYRLSSFTLFNTSNSVFNDRGTGRFIITGSNTLEPGLSSGPVLVTGVPGLTAAVGGAPIAGNSFASENNGAFRYLQFRPFSVLTSGTPCCGQEPGLRSFGLNELRVFGTLAPVTPAVPEPASWAMMIGGFGLVGFAMRRRRSASAAFA